MNDQKQKARAVLEAFLEAGGHRRTPERFAVLDLVYELYGHFEPEEIVNRLKKGKNKVSRATVYNTLDLLQRCRLVQRRDLGQGRVVYEKALGFRQHDHLVCSQCSRVFEFCDPRLLAVEESIGHALGFEVTEHNLILTGNCRREECRKKGNPGNDG